MYETKYKDQKDSEDNGDRINKNLITQKESESQNQMFSPSLTSIKEELNHDFLPNLTGAQGEDRSFNPSLDNPKDTANASFKPQLESKTEKKDRNFTPSLEMPEKLQTSVRRTGREGIIDGAKNIEDIKKINRMIPQDVNKQTEVKREH